MPLAAGVDDDAVRMSVMDEMPWLAVVGATFSVKLREYEELELELVKILLVVVGVRLISVPPRPENPVVIDTFSNDEQVLPL